MCTYNHKNEKEENTMSTTMTVRLEKSTKERLEKLAKSSHRSKSFLAAAAIKQYLELNEWQMEEIQAGLKEADAGDFATDQEVNKVFSQ